MGSKPPTGTDVARLAGVSKSAVSRAFTGGVVSPDARARIREAAKTLKYRPSLTARSLTTSQSKLIGVAITHLDNQYYPEVVERLSKRLSEAGYRLVLFITRGEREEELEPVLDELLGYRLDGVILASSSMAAHIASECMEARVPVIMFNNIDSDGIVPGISADNVHGATQVARHLIDSGHIRFGVIAGLSESSASVERCDAFCNEIRNAGLPPPRIEVGGFTFEGAQRAMRALMVVDEGPDAVFCVNDHMALAALQTARELGFTPGVDLSIAGFDNVAVSAWPAFALTTYAQPIEDMIEETVSQLIERIGGASEDRRTMRLKGSLIVRSSTMPISISASNAHAGEETIVEK